MNPILMVRTDQGRRYMRLDLEPNAAKEVAETFRSAAAEFAEGTEEYIEFTPGYKALDHECFEIREFALDEELITACRQPLSVERVDASSFADLSVFGLAGYDFSSGQQKIYFQNFDSRRVLVPGNRFAVMRMADSSTFERLSKPVILLDAKVAAVWDSGFLRFKSFHLAKQLFDLSSYFAEASDEQVKDFSGHGSLHCRSRENFLRACSSWSRTKIALILRGGILDRATVQEIEAAAGRLSFGLTVESGRIVLPEDKREIRELLQFLDEDIYNGPLSQRNFISSGKRER